jgi:tripartite-type tricarboxylate transporter receptor subunit TctC
MQSLARKRLAGLFLVLAASGVTAQAVFPDRPIKLIVPFAAGGTADTAARSLAERVKATTGQAVVVDNKVGATGNIGAQAVVAAPPDGYTILFHSSAVVINPWMMKVAFDIQKDLVPITQIASTSYVMTVAANHPAQTAEDFLAIARKSPGKTSCMTYGIGSPPHLWLELLKQAAGVDILHVPYRAFGQALPDLVSGRLDCIIEPPTTVIPQVRSGTIRALVVTGAALEQLPGVPSISKLYPTAAVEGWQGLFAPAGTPKPVIAKLHAEFAGAVHTPEVAKRIRDAGFRPVGGTPDALGGIISEELAKFGDVIRKRNIKAE